MWFVTMESSIIRVENMHNNETAEQVHFLNYRRGLSWVCGNLKRMFSNTLFIELIFYIYNRTTWVNNYA